MKKIQRTFHYQLIQLKVNGYGPQIPDDRTYANTMFEFVDGNVYTSYAANCGWADNYCTDADFNALDATDRIPGVDTYTFDGDTLTWGEFPRAVSFECDGGIMINENSYKLWRLNSDCE